jgi:hypothetical protein
LWFHIWQAESHAQPGNVSGPDEIVHECLIVLLVSFQLGPARILLSAFPIHQSSIHKAEERASYMGNELRFGGGVWGILYGLEPKFREMQNLV